MGDKVYRLGTSMMILGIGMMVSPSVFTEFGQKIGTSLLITGFIICVLSSIMS